MTINITLPFAKQRAKIKHYFHRPVIIYSKYHEPAKLIIDWQTPEGKKYCRVQFQNRQKVKGMVPMTDIPASNVIAAMKLHSPFMKQLAKWNIIDPQKKHDE